MGVVSRSWQAVHSQTSQSGAIAEPLLVLLLHCLNETLFVEFYFLNFLNFLPMSDLMSGSLPSVQYAFFYGPARFCE